MVLSLGRSSVAELMIASDVGVPDIALAWKVGGRVSPWPIISSGTMARDRHENHRTFGAVQGRQVDCQLTLDC
jgi:hypothetical protein